MCMPVGKSPPLRDGGPTALGLASPSSAPFVSGRTVKATTMVEFQLAMTHVLEGHRHELVDLCRKYRVRRLDVFGSAARGDFNEHSSDVDLLVEFDDMAYADRADAYLGFLTAVEALLRRRVDLVELSAVRNPYLRRGIEESRELVYAA